jgi:hypothetical protein
MDNPPCKISWVKVNLFEPEKKFVSSYRLKPLLPDENEVSAIKLRKTIVMVFEKSRARAEKIFSRPTC